MLFLGYSRTRLNPDANFVDSKFCKTLDVTIANLDKMAMPAVLELVWKDGSRQRVALPVETWLQDGKRTLHFASAQPLVGATIDPDHVLPDENRGNNGWKAGQ